MQKGLHATSDWKESVEQSTHTSCEFLLDQIKEFYVSGFQDLMYGPILRHLLRYNLLSNSGSEALSTLLNFSNFKSLVCVSVPGCS